MLHVIPRHYVLDGHTRVRQPLAMHGFRLEVEANIVTASTPSVNNLEQAVEGAGVLVDRFIVSPLAAGDAVLTEDEREAGVVLIDIGAGTADMGIFVEGAVWHTHVVPIAGDLVTSDISHWLQVSVELAEMVKLQRGHCVPKRVSELETFLVEPFGEGLPVETKRRELADVVGARVEEIFEKIRDEIKRSGYDGLLRAGPSSQAAHRNSPAFRNSPVKSLTCDPHGQAGKADGPRRHAQESRLFDQRRAAPLAYSLTRYRCR